MEATQPTPPRSDILELLVKVAALVAVVLPIVGAGVRATAFALAGVSNPLGLAVAEPVSVLATTALVAVAPIAAAIVALAPFLYRDWPRPKVPPRRSNLSLRAARAAVALGILLLVVAVFILPWPAGLVWILGGGVSSWLLGLWSARQELTFYRVSTVVFLAAIVTALGAGLNGIAVGDQVYHYRFSTNSVISDGNYALAGESDGFVYLESCQRPGIEGVSQQDIVEFSAVKGTEPLHSLYEIIFRGGSLNIGYHRGC
jgi:hypothetical protein